MGLSSLLSQVLRGYLDNEHRNKKNRPFDFTDWVDWVDEVRRAFRIVGFGLLIPTQGNTTTRERLRLWGLYMPISASLVPRKGR